MLFDTHAHPYITFHKNSEEILHNFFTLNSNNRCISIGCDIESSKKCIDLANKYTHIKATIGIHPCDISYNFFSQVGSLGDTEISAHLEKDIHELKELYGHDKKHIVAIGEIGLDFYHIDSISEKTGLNTRDITAIQTAYFRAQIRLAKELGLPFIIHSRESNDEVLDILQQENAENYVFHCFSGNWDFTQKVLIQNPAAMFGFGGPLTFKKSLALQEVAQKLPIERILIETDSPFLTPEPLRGREENEPKNVAYILAKLQDLRKESSEEIGKKVYENAQRFFAT